MKAWCVVPALLLAACGSRDPGAGHSHAADEVIARAQTAEEREALTRIRDEVDAAARDRIRDLDAEIARLEKENTLLRTRGQVAH